MQPKTVMTERTDPGPSSDVMGQTREDEPNIKIIALPWWKMIGIRAIRVYLQSLVGFLSVGVVGIETVDAGTFTQDLWLAMGLAFAPTIMSILTNSLEILNKLDISHPEMRA